MIDPIVKPMMLAQVLVNEDDKIQIEEVENIDVNGYFTIEQRYIFPIHDFVDGEESTTMLRCIIPEGTHHLEGYREVRESLDALGLDPVAVSEVMEMPEIMCGYYEDEPVSQYEPEDG